MTSMRPFLVLAVSAVSSAAHPRNPLRGLDTTQRRLEGSLNVQRYPASAVAQNRVSLEKFAKAKSNECYKEGLKPTEAPGEHMDMTIKPKHKTKQKKTHDSS